MKICNAHEHLQSSREVPDLLRLMDQHGIAETVVVGSGDVTIFQRWSMSFTNYHERNLDLLKGAKAHCDRVYIFPCLNPLDENNLALMDNYFSLGARGIKLYYGLATTHAGGPWHSVPLDYEGMLPVFEFCQSNSLPVLFHANRVSYFDELLGLLTKFPRLRICIPHLMVSSRTPHRLKMVEAVLNNFPNVFTDNSHGRENLLLPVAQNFSRRSDLFRQFFTKYSDRIMWGTDLVLSRHKFDHMGAYLDRMVQWYKDLTDSDGYTAPTEGNSEPLRGLNLSPENIYSAVFDKWLNGQRLER